MTVESHALQIEQHIKALQELVQGPVAILAIPLLDAPSPPKGERAFVAAMTGSDNLHKYPSLELGFEVINSAIEGLGGIRQGEKKRKREVNPFERSLTSRAMADTISNVTSTLLDHVIARPVLLDLAKELNGSSTPSTSDMLDTLRDSLLAATGIDLKVELEGCETSEDIRAAMESIKKKADKLKAERNARTTH